MIETGEVSSSVVVDDNLYFFPDEKKFHPNLEYAIKCQEHHCGFFGTEDEARIHLENCLSRRVDRGINGNYYRQLYGKEICKVCKREELSIEYYGKRTTFPYGGPDGMMGRVRGVFVFLYSKHA